MDSMSFIISSIADRLPALIAYANEVVRCFKSATFYTTNGFSRLDRSSLSASDTIVRSIIVRSRETHRLVSQNEIDPRIRFTASRPWERMYAICLGSIEDMANLHSKRHNNIVRLLFCLNSFSLIGSFDLVALCAKQAY
jgi:hypothetical protein